MNERIGHAVLHPREPAQKTGLAQHPVGAGDAFPQSLDLDDHLKRVGPAQPGVPAAREPVEGMCRGFLERPHLLTHAHTFLFSGEFDSRTRPARFRPGSVPGRKRMVGTGRFRLRRSRTEPS